MRVKPPHQAIDKLNHVIRRVFSIMSKSKKANNNFNQAYAGTTRNLWRYPFCFYNIERLHISLTSDKPLQWLMNRIQPLNRIWWMRVGRVKEKWAENEYLGILSIPSLEVFKKRKRIASLWPQWYISHLRISSNFSCFDISVCFKQQQKQHPKTSLNILHRRKEKLQTHSYGSVRHIKV